MTIIPEKYKSAVLPVLAKDLQQLADERNIWAQEARERDQPGSAREFELASLALMKIKKLQETLDWYAEKAEYIQRKLKEFKDGKNVDPIMAVLTELSLDGGERARKAKS